MPEAALLNSGTSVGAGSSPTVFGPRITTVLVGGVVAAPPRPDESPEVLPVGQQKLSAAYPLNPDKFYLGQNPAERRGSQRMYFDGD